MIFVLRTGAVNADWNNAQNWSCFEVPTTTSAVIVAAGKSNYPTIQVNTKVNSLTLMPGARVEVKAGVELRIEKNQ